MNQGSEPRPLLYGELASWFHLLTAPEDYVLEAQYNAGVIQDAASIPVKTVLELGSGGGNNASHMKARFKMTLTDISEEMLAVSRGINPECEHIQGDMTSLRLQGKTFDAIFVHDAVSYLTSETDIRGMLETASAHCRPGGVVLVVPDHVLETFTPPCTEHGGNDGRDGRSLRYLMWTTDPDPGDTTYQVDFAYLLREADGALRVEYDRHTCGVFSEETWLTAFREQGFDAAVRIDPWGTRVFEGVKARE